MGGTTTGRGGGGRREGRVLAEGAGRRGEGRSQRYFPSHAPITVMFTELLGSFGLLEGCKVVRSYERVLPTF